jgi:signal transduction histidine kinase
LPAESVVLSGDPLRLDQVFTNLLTNAAKYTEPGGEISVSLSIEPEPGETPGEPGSGAEYAVVRVRDSGIGIDPETLAHIFDLFFQVDRTHARTHGGLGIGLNMVRRLVDLHHGWVEAHSEGQGQGSEFVVWLPLER